MRVITDPLSRFTLANGLKVVVQSSHRVPLVTATLIYDVGSKDEKEGEFGYAHLFEHLMIDGSEHWNQDAFRSLSDLGGTNVNATTTQDKTIFYETFPSAALERVMFLEADRMGNLAPALTPERVKREVGVVLNEKRLRGNAPFGHDDELTRADIYPVDHPYRHSPIGDERDLNAVTVEVARHWFDAFYGPSNATLILTGDVAPDRARALVEKYFAGLAPRLPRDRLLTRTVPLPGPLRRQVFAAVPQARIDADYIAPAAGSPDIANLDLIAQIMANGVRSRLNRRIVEELHLARSAFVTFDEGQLSSRMGFVLDGVPPDEVARAGTELDAVLARFVAEGPTPDELKRAQAARIRFVLGSQGSTFGKAFLLMRGASFTDDPDYAQTYLRQLRDATPDSVRRTAEAVYGRPGYRLFGRPVPRQAATAGGYDLARGAPPVGSMAPIVFPAVEQARLSNGLRVVLVPRPGSTTDNLLLRLDSGTAGSARLIAPLAMDMLAGRAPTPDQRDRGARVEALGGRLGDELDHDHADLTLSLETSRLAPGIAALGDLLAHPGASADALAALRKTRAGQLAGESASPNALAGRLLNNAIYGAGHPYASGAYAEADIRALEAIDVRAVLAWDRGHLRPDRATLYVAADTGMAQLRPLLERSLAGWRNEGPAAVVPPIPPAAGTATPSLIVIDRPGATQTFVMAGKVLPGATGTAAAADLATKAANEVFGGNFTSRIGTNLRHDKGWTYGIGSGLYDSRGERRWILAGSVDRDHTGASIAEIIGELRGLTGDRPTEQGELDRIATTSANRSAAKLEGNAELLGAMADSESDGQHYDEVARRPTALRALTIGDVRRASAALSDPAQLHWVLVGDWKRIRDQLGDLKLGDPVVIDPAK